MRLLLQLLGLALMLLGVYFLGKNIWVATDISPYWWRGVATDLSIGLLSLGVWVLVLLPINRLRQFGALFLVLGIFCFWASGRVLLQLPYLWEFLVSVVAFIFGYRFWAIGRMPF